MAQAVRTERPAAALVSDATLSNTLMNWAAYVTVVGGYLLVVLSTPHLTLPGFLLLTALHAAWLAFFHRLCLPNLSAREATLDLAGLALCALGASAVVWLGMPFDYFMAFATVAIFALSFPFHLSVAVSVGIWAGTATLLAVAGRTWPPQDMLREQVALLPGFVFSYAFAYGVRIQQEQRMRAEALAAEVARAHEQLRMQAAQAEELAVERERNRLAREIHDTLGHYLTLLAVQLETSLKLEARGDARLHAELTEARRVATECLAEVRRSVSALRPDHALATGLEEALRRLVAEYEAAQPGTDLVLDIEGAAAALPPELRLALYRSAQEALTNVRKHAQASKVLVRLRVQPERAELVVLDNGAGAHPAAAPGFGLLGMRERIELLGGTARALPEPERGWRVEVALPLPPAEVGAHA